jgi:predicted nucleotide-binding protein (sugar kinase/HSP70/actin superfamily)
MLDLTKQRKRLMKEYPNLVDYESKQLFRHFYDQPPMPTAETLIDDVEVKKGLFGIKRTPIRRPFQRSSAEAQRKRAVDANRHSQGAQRVEHRAVSLRTYLETLGIQRQNVVFSDDTSEEMWQEGGKYGSIDPCYPSKVAQAHIHNLLFHQHSEKKPLHIVFLPVHHPRDRRDFTR